MNTLRGASCFSASLKAGAWAAGSLNGLALYLACAPATPTEKLCLQSDALSPADQIMPPWVVLVDCRGSGHIWKSRQYKGNALGSAVHVTAT